MTTGEFLAWLGCMAALMGFWAWFSREVRKGKTVHRLTMRFLIDTGQFEEAMRRMQRSMELLAFSFSRGLRPAVQKAQEAMDEFGRIYAKIVNDTSKPRE